MKNQLSEDAIVGCFLAGCITGTGAGLITIGTVDFRKGIGLGLLVGVGSIFLFMFAVKLTRCLFS